MTKRTMPRRMLLTGLAALPLSLSSSTALARRIQTPGVEGIDTGISIEITAIDDAFEMPPRVPAGFVTLTLRNEGEGDHAAQLLHVKPGVLVPAVTEALHSGLDSISALASLVGGPGHTRPGGSQTVVQNLSPGSHMVIDTVVNKSGVPQFVTGLPRPFEVVATAEAGSEPGAAGEIQLSDFHIEGLPAELPAGPQVWSVATGGLEPHELGIRLLDEGVTAQQVIDMIAAQSAGTSGSSSASETLAFMANLPVSNAGGIQAMDPGLTGWMLLDLEPGEYLAVCMVPSPPNEQAPHAALGMLQGFTVSAN